jgi:tetratricopeptide (TPR) repeat protein
MQMSKATNHARRQAKAPHARASQYDIPSPLAQTPGLWILISCVMIVICAIVAYAPSFAGQFTFDDYPNITRNGLLRNPQTAGQVLIYLFGSMRPVVNATIMLNYHTTGLDLWAFHAVNLTIHILAGLTLLGLLRRTFAAPQVGQLGSGLAPIFPPRTGMVLSLIIALLWVVHPLNTQAVTYIIQRGESMAGLFYLLTIYCLARSYTSPKPGLWAVLSVVSCSLGMGCKQIMATAPILALIYGRVFFAKSFKETFAKRPGLYLGLAGTWLILICMVVIFPTGPTAGGGVETISPLAYQASELGVVAQYLFLAIWPAKLCIDYGWPVATAPLEIILPGLLIAALLVLSAIGLRRGRQIGFAGVWFFLILAPTSTILPIADLAMEHRMYLSSIAVIALAVIGAYALGNILVRRSIAQASTIRAVGVGLATVVAFTLGYLTYQRNILYQDVAAIWKDALPTRPGNFRSRAHLAEQLAKLGRADEGIYYFYEALKIAPDNTKVIGALGLELLRAGRLTEAAEQLAKLADLDVNARILLATAHARMGLLDQSASELRQALATDPLNAWAYHDLGGVLVLQGKPLEAIECSRQAYQAMPQLPRVANDLAYMIAVTPGASDQDVQLALSAGKSACELTGWANAGYALSLSGVFARLGQWDKAITVADGALGLAKSANQAALASDIESAIEKYKRRECLTRNAKPGGTTLPSAEDPAISPAE